MIDPLIEILAIKILIQIFNSHKFAVLSRIEYDHQLSLYQNMFMYVANYTYILVRNT